MAERWDALLVARLLLSLAVEWVRVVVMCWIGETLGLLVVHYWEVACLTACDGLCIDRVLLCLGSLALAGGDVDGAAGVWLFVGFSGRFADDHHLSVRWLFLACIHGQFGRCICQRWFEALSLRTSLSITLSGARGILS